MNPWATSMPNTPPCSHYGVSSHPYHHHENWAHSPVYCQEKSKVTSHALKYTKSHFLLSKLQDIKPTDLKDVERSMDSSVSQRPLLLPTLAFSIPIRATGHRVGFDTKNAKPHEGHWWSKDLL